MKDFIEILNDFFKFDLIKDILTGTYFDNIKIDEKDQNENMLLLTDKTAIVVYTKKPVS